MTEIKNIENPFNVEIIRRQLYNDVYQYSLPYEYYFESEGTFFGNTIYAGEVPDNHYIIRKKKTPYEPNTTENSK